MFFFHRSRNCALIPFLTVFRYAISNSFVPVRLFIIKFIFTQYNLPEVLNFQLIVFDCKLRTILSLCEETKVNLLVMEPISFIINSRLICLPEISNVR